MKMGLWLLLHASGPVWLHATCTKMTSCHEACRYSVTNSHLRGLLPVTTSNSAPLTQSVFNKGEKTTTIDLSINLGFNSENRVSRCLCVWVE